MLAGAARRGPDRRPAVAGVPARGRQPATAGPAYTPVRAVSRPDLTASANAA